MTARRIIPLALLLVIACDRDAPPRTDSVSQAPANATDVPWVPELGEVLAVPGDSDNSALVLFPREPADSQIDVSLLRTSGDSSVTARIAPGDMQVCGDVPTAQVSAPGPSGWTIALGRAVTPVRLDTVDGASATDSSELAASAARLASAVPDDRASRFSGLPFALLAARRLSLAGSSVLIARVARRIPQEATPLEERTLVIGERVGDEPYTLKYSLRAAGPEDKVEHHLVLGAVRAADKHFVIIEVERESGSRYEILERTPDGAWQLRWSRTLTC